LLVFLGYRRESPSVDEEEYPTCSDDGFFAAHDSFSLQVNDWRPFYGVVDSGLKNEETKSDPWIVARPFVGAVNGEGEKRLGKSRASYDFFSLRPFKKPSF
jgi:hypothetical protein